MVIVFSFCALCLFMPKETYSKSERRNLKEFPTLSINSVFSGTFMKNFEEYATDTFPFRDSFRTLKAYTSKYIFSKKDNNGYYIDSDGYISKKEYPQNDDSLENAAEKLQNIYNSCFKNKNFNVYTSIIPDKNAFMSQDILQIDYDAFKNTFIKKLGFGTYIDIFSVLKKEDYYKTDTHWKQECILPVAQTLASAMNTKLETKSEKITLENDFYGVYYGQAALNGKADKITYLTNSHIENAKVYDFQNGKEISVYNFEKANGKDPYEFFLSGSLSLITIQNEKCENNKELIIFRDSFSSSLTPLLISGYKKITLVDIRYISVDVAKKFTEFKEGSDVLFIYSTLVLNNSKEFK